MGLKVESGRERDDTLDTLDLEKVVMINGVF